MLSILLTRRSYMSTVNLNRYYTNWFVKVRVANTAPAIASSPSASSPSLEHLPSCVQYQGVPEISPALLRERHELEYLRAAARERPRRRTGRRQRHERQLEAEQCWKRLQMH